MHGADADRIEPRRTAAHPYDTGNLAATYTAIAVLAVLGDDFARLRRDPILQVRVMVIALRPD